MEKPEIVTQVHGDVKNPQNKEISSQLLNSLAALHGELDSLSPAAYIHSLPSVVRRRIKALKKLQSQTLAIESEFYEEMHALECKYENLYKPLYDKRHAIVSAMLEPSDDDCDWPSDTEDALSEEMQVKLNVGEKQHKELPVFDDEIKGVPDFWLQIFKNVDILSEMVEEHDEPILKSLYDIEVQMLPSDPKGFILKFHFCPNNYFTNKTLSKTYILRCKPDPEDPLEYDGPEIVKCHGCVIDWKEGMNVTTKKVKKAESHKGGQTNKKTFVDITCNDSFFNFFSPPQVAPGEEPDDEIEERLSQDFEVGHFIRDRIISKAVLYYTGQALDDDEYDDEDDDEEEQSGGQDDSDDAA